MLRIRRANPCDAAQIARVNVDTWRAAYKGILPQKYLDKLTYKDREAYFSSLLYKREDSTFIFVAEKGNEEIAGFAAGGPERTLDSVYLGELYTIYIKKEYQGNGMGTMLTGAVARELGSRSMNSMLVRVLAENPYRRFYESLGGIKLSDRTIVVEGETCPVTVYGWLDTAGIVERFHNFVL